MKYCWLNSTVVILLEPYYYNLFQQFTLDLEILILSTISAKFATVCRVLGSSLFVLNHAPVLFFFSCRSVKRSTYITSRTASRTCCSDDKRAAITDSLTVSFDRANWKLFFILPEEAETGSFIGADCDFSARFQPRLNTPYGE